MMNALRLAVLAVALLCAACDAATNPFDATPAAPSAERASIPPTTPSATRTLADNLQTALSRTPQSAVHRLSLAFTLGTTTNGQYREQSFLDFDAAINGAATHAVYHGSLFNELLGGGDPIEVIAIGSKAYLKGSTLFGATEPDQWYAFSDSTLGKPPFDVGDLLAQMGDSVEGAKRVTSETLDGLECQMWLVDFKTKAGTLIDVASNEYNKGDFNVLDSATARITTCADGYVHKLAWNIEAHSQTDANYKGSIGVSAHLFDFDASFSIKAPDGAIELR